jgi:hypothetical protein
METTQTFKNQYHVLEAIRSKDCLDGGTRSRELERVEAVVNS